MKVGRESSGTPRSGFSNGFATSTATLAGSPLLRTTCWRAVCGIAKYSCRCGTIPGHAQVDFGEALAEIAGGERKIHFFAIDLPHSDACFVQAYPAETAEAFCDGHNAAFAFFGKVPRSILYDNTTLAVARILGDGVRQRTRVFSELQSHYVFDDRFGRPGKGNDKGKVEGLIGWIRRNLLVPVPRAASFTALNEQLLEGCRRRLADR